MFSPAAAFSGDNNFTKRCNSSRRAPRWVTQVVSSTWWLGTAMATVSGGARVTAVVRLNGGEPMATSCTGSFVSMRNARGSPQWRPSAAGCTRSAKAQRRSRRELAVSVCTVTTAARLNGGDPRVTSCHLAITRTWRSRCSLNQELPELGAKSSTPGGHGEGVRRRRKAPAEPVTF